MRVRVRAGFGQLGRGRRGEGARGGAAAVQGGGGAAAPWTLARHTPNLPGKIIPAKIRRLKVSGKFPTLDMRIPPLKHKIMPESSPLKSRILVRRLAVRLGPSSMCFFRESLSHSPSQGRLRLGPPPNNNKRRVRLRRVRDLKQCASIESKISNVQL